VEIVGHVPQQLVARHRVVEAPQRDVDARLKNLSALIEPVLILVLGVVVGAIALAVLLPIYGLLNVVA